MFIGHLTEERRRASLNARARKTINQKDNKKEHLFILFITGRDDLQSACLPHFHLPVSISALIRHLFLPPNKIYHYDIAESELG